MASTGVCVARKGNHHAYSITKAMQHPQTPTNAFLRGLQKTWMHVQQAAMTL